MEDLHSGKNHKIQLTNRESGIISGVNAVVSFDPNEILLDTEQGVLLLKGKDLNVTKLTLEKGEVEIDGHVDSFTYSERKSGSKTENGLFERLFK